MGGLPCTATAECARIDSLKTALGSTYSLADTEIPPTQHGYTRTGNFHHHPKQ